MSSGKGVLPSTISFLISVTSYNRRTVISLSAKESVSEKRLHKVKVKDWVVWVIKFSEASEIGMKAGC